MSSSTSKIMKHKIDLMVNVMNCLEKFSTSARFLYNKCPIAEYFYKKGQKVVHKNVS